MIDARLDLLEKFRPDIISNLMLLWRDDDLCLPTDFHLALASAPSITKEALKCGLLSGRLELRRGGLVGRLELTAEGRYLVRRMVRRMRVASSPEVAA
ncbi:MAG: hypothetical protein EOQ98_19260 [Mesorhizobium sp.]|uniref:hypothetical protein n=1 Tax=Mesorhizobium sp. TaxID=1871066 RepID=UPI000FD23663|nr:hypothetical protein [Mesorhizobium sp.]RUU27834.1 hypothetical protein EOD08_21855 [Mesorhizobium sp. M6A.T.Ca.TU.002.02.2.1]RWO97173.1 MAG: hypothetical protein EOQ98_19260 [Mesorhizobium sp.]TIM52609.1 MAG: hypothetical protein E5Y69_00885 [Mesorhizobium sp.]